MFIKGKQNVLVELCQCFWAHRTVVRALPVTFVWAFMTHGQTTFSQTANDVHESERSDRLTGGRVEQAAFEAGQPDVRLTLNVPSFRLALWQNGKEVKSWYIGVGFKDHPIYIGDLSVLLVILRSSYSNSYLPYFPAAALS